MSRQTDFQIFSLACFYTTVTVVYTLRATARQPAVGAAEGKSSLARITSTSALCGLPPGSRPGSRRAQAVGLRRSS